MELVFDKKRMCMIAGYAFAGPYWAFALRGTSGIYIPLGDYNQALYVGESEDICERVQNHKWEQCWEEKGFIGEFAVFETSVSKKGRLAIEKKVYQVVEPPCGHPPA